MRRTLLTLLLAVAAAVLVVLPAAATEGGGGAGGAAEQPAPAEEDGLWDGLILAAIIALPVGLAIYVDANADRPAATDAPHD